MDVSSGDGDWFWARSEDGDANNGNPADSFAHKQRLVSIWRGGRGSRCHRIEERVNITTILSLQ